MSVPTTSIQFSPFLQEQRKFPTEDIKALAFQNDLAYIETARSVNYRTIGIHVVDFPTATGEKFYLQGGGANIQQSLRQLFPFTGAGSIPHGINFDSVSFVSPRTYGTYTDGTDWFGAIYSTSVGIAGQVTFYVTSTNIVITVDAGAPAVTSGFILLEWVSQI